MGSSTPAAGHRSHAEGSGAERAAPAVGDYIDDVEPGSVVVLDNGGRENATVWGDILTWVASRRGVAGTVIDGACRDTHLCREFNHPIYSRSYSMRTGKDRVQVEAMNVVVNIGDARVAPGDLVRGDADGVLVIPRDHEDAVLAAAEQIDGIEQRIRALINEGHTLTEARRQLGCHQLQSRRSDGVATEFKRRQLAYRSKT
jgi:regulator of RNase E activity RraA